MKQNNEYIKDKNLLLEIGKERGYLLVTEIAEMVNNSDITEEDILRFHEERIALGIGLLYSKPKNIFGMKSREKMLLCACSSIFILSFSALCFSEAISAWKTGIKNEKQDKDGVLITQDHAYLYRRNHEFLDLKKSAETLTLVDTKRYLSGAVMQNSRIFATDEQNVYLSEIYPEVTQEFRDTLFANDNEEVLEKIVEDYWNNYLFHTSTYEILRLEDTLSGQITYICGYVIEETNMIYNFETNALEVYPTALITKDENMNSIMNLSEATRGDILLAFQNYLADITILKRTN